MYNVEPSSRLAPPPPDQRTRPVGADGGRLGECLGEFGPHAARRRRGRRWGRRRRDGGDGDSGRRRRGRRRGRWVRRGGGRRGSWRVRGVGGELSSQTAHAWCCCCCCCLGVCMRYYCCCGGDFAPSSKAASSSSLKSMNIFPPSHPPTVPATARVIFTHRVTDERLRSRLSIRSSGGSAAPSPQGSDARRPFGGTHSHCAARGTGEWECRRGRRGEAWSWRPGGFG